VDWALPAKGMDVINFYAVQQLLCQLVTDFVLHRRKRARPLDLSHHYMAAWSSQVKMIQSLFLSHQESVEYLSHFIVSSFLEVHILVVRKLVETRRL
jgi:hypothetical protein